MNILITGASSGIGYELALQYSKNKENCLFLIGRNIQSLQKLSTLCKQNGAKIVQYHQCDVSDQLSIGKILTTIDNSHPIDLLIANAGVSAGTLNGTESQEQTNTICSINIGGVLNTVLPIIEGMKGRKSGQIALMSSVASFFGLPSCPSYSASKAFVRFYGQALRYELINYGIKVNVIAPGYIKTPMTNANNFKMPFLMPVEKACKIIIKSLAKNKPLIAFPKIMRLLVLSLSILPEAALIQILKKIPKKKPLN